MLVEVNSHAKSLRCLTSDEETKQQDAPKSTRQTREDYFQLVGVLDMLITSTIQGLIIDIGYKAEYIMQTSAPNQQAQLKGGAKAGKAESLEA